MNFHPEHLFDTNRSENFVWEALKAALSDLPGDAFYRYPVVGADKFMRYEPDVLILLRGAMPLILECKGCRLQHIGGIQGAVWMMNDTWYRLQEQPLTQARSQAIAMRRMLESRGVDGVQVQALVALPFVSRDDWLTTPFGNLASTDVLLFAQDFAPDRLRERILCHLAHHSLDPGRGDAVSRCLGAIGQSRFIEEGSEAQGAAGGGAGAGAGDSALGSSGALAPIRVLRYAGKPPTAKELASVIPLIPETSYTYLVATSALERQRRSEGLGGQHQLKKDLRLEAQETEEMQLLFHKALRHFIGMPMLTRAEEGVVLQRAIREVAAHDPQMSRQLLRDVFKWRDALAELEEEGVDLSMQPAGDCLDWAHPSLRKVARTLQTTYCKLRQEVGQGRTSFEDLAGRYLDNVYRPTPVVVLEGFTRLTPLQCRFIDACARHAECQIWIVQPYSAAQERGFAAIDRTYGPLRERLQLLVVPVEPLTEQLALGHVHTDLFATEASVRAIDDEESVQIRAFPHRNDEIAACVDEVIRALEDPAQPLRAQDLAVVCSDPVAMEPLLREQAELRGRPDLFSVPPRQLLLTPVGRFALTLYEIWSPEGLCLDPDRFATLLASGWLGAQAQRSVDRFLAVAAQQFTHCRSADEWHSAFERIRRLHAGDAALRPLAGRLPASLVDKEQLVLWEEGVRVAVRLCTRLLRPGERPLGEHIRQLLDEIERLDPQRVLQAEREILARIREALAELTDARSVGVDGQEFGQVLSGLIRERQEAGGEPPEDGPSGRTVQRVWVTGPEGIDNVTRDTVFFLGLEDSRLPATGLPQWPRARWSAQEHVERQRYRFLGVVRAARRRVWLSFSRQDWERDYGPSPYLEEVAQLLGREDALARAPAAAPAVRERVPHAPRQGLRLQREDYSLDELALFRLCPHRFKLEAHSPWGRCYADGWQLQWLARGVWLAEAFARVAEAVPSGALAGAVEAALLQAIDDAAPDVKERFAGLPHLDWLGVESAVRAAVKYLLDPGPHRDTVLTGIERAGPADGRKELVLPGGRRSVAVHARPDFLQCRDNNLLLLPDSHQAATWLIYGKKDVPPSEGVEEGLVLFRTLYEAVGWWRQMYRALLQPQPLRVDVANELVGAVLDLEAASFPKNPGDHCRYCPVRFTCMGVRP